MDLGPNYEVSLKMVDACDVPDDATVAVFHSEDDEELATMSLGRTFLNPQPPQTQFEDLIRESRFTVMYVMRYSGLRIGDPETMLRRKRKYTESDVACVSWYEVSIIHRSQLPMAA